MDRNNQKNENENLKKFKALAENSFDVLTIIDSNGVILYESKATKSVFGYEAGERVGQNVFDFIHPDDFNMASEKFEELIKSSPETSVMIEFRFRDSNNNWIWLETSGRNFLHDNDINGIITNARDITGSKLNKLKLQERNKELNAFYVLSELSERKDLSIDEICQKFIDTFPESWQYPDKAYARLIVKNKEFCTDNFQNTKWKQSATVNVFGSEAGKIEVGYPEDISQKYESLFLEEEKKLLKAIAERIGKIIENRQAEEDIKIAKEKAENSEEELQKMYNDLQATEEELRAANEELVVTSDALKDSNDKLLQAKEKAEKREKSISTILENIPHAVFTHDMDGNFVFVNNRATQYTGYSNDELLKMNVSDIDKNTLTKNYRENIWRQLDKTGHQQVLTEHTRKDGSEYPVEIFVSAISIDNKPIFLAIGQDITERKKAEEKLHRFRAALDNSADQIFIIDWDKMLFIDVNETACKDLNYSRSELLAMGPHDIKPYHSAETLKVEFDKIIRKKSRFGVIETVHRKKRGGDIPVEVRMKMLELNEKKLFVALARDITEQKKAFDKIKMNEKLKTLSTEILSVLNNPDNLTKTLSQIVSSVKNVMDFDAVGIRLNKNSDFPYFVQEGFSEEHLINENELIATDENGNIIKDREGNNRLECTCGLILSGYTNTKLPVFTKSGSFWTNDSAKLLELPPGEDPRLNPRNKCIFDGYNSMALIPIKANNQIKGLLHLNKKNKGAFNRNLIEQFEEICSKIGMALFRNQIEEQLRLSEKKFRDLFETANDAIFIAEKDTGIIIDVNSSGEKLTGRSRNNIIGIHQSELHPRSDENTAKKVFKNTSATKKALFEFKVVHNNGSIIPVEISASAMHINDKKFVFGFFRDISERKQAEELINMRFKLLEYATTHSLDEVLQYTLDLVCNLSHSAIGFYHFVDQNQKTLSLKAWSTNTHKHCHIKGEKMQYSVDKAGVWIDCIKERKPIIHNNYDELSHKKGLPEGHVPVKRQLVVPIFRNEKIVAILGVGNKPENYEEKDTDIVAYFADLTWQVAEQKKTEDELIKAKKLAEKTNKAKSEFLANMSHEIRTPLYGVIGYNELLMQNTELTTKQETYVKKSNVSAKLLMDLINDILDFSIIESNKLELEEIKTDIIELAKDVSNVIESKAEEKNIDIKLNIDDNIPRFAFIDPLRLRQVLINLLGNAVKFTEKGEIELTISFTKDTRKYEKGKFHFSVRDTGIGISQVNQKKLFQAFSQADTSTKRKYGGTGLGLIISSKIVQKMGSELQMKSRPGKGSTFYFTVEKHYEYSEPVKAKKEEKQDIKITENTPVILLVEDTEMVMCLVKSILKQSIPKVSIVEATNGVEGVIKYKESNPDMVLLDIQMPLKDGYTVAREIRRFEKENNLPRKPIVALTARVIKSEKEKCLKAGMDDYLPKPIDKKELTYTIEKYITKNIAKSEKNTGGNNYIQNEKQVKHFDKESLLRRLDYDHTELEKLLRMALSKIPVYIENLKNAIEKNSSKHIAQTAHKLKGAALFISFDRLGKLAEKIEYKNEKEKYWIKEIYNEIEKELQEVRRKVRGK